MFFLPIFIFVAILIWSLVFPIPGGLEQFTSDPRGLFALAAILIMDCIFAVITAVLLLWTLFQLFVNWKESRTRRWGLATSSESPER